MSGLFGGKPDTSAQEKQLEVQQKQVEQQEERQKAEIALEGKKLQAATRARSQAGRRMLLADREDAELGLSGGVDIYS